MIILDYLAYELSLIILPMNYPWLSCRCEKCFCTPPLRWSGEYLKPENGRRCSSLANQVAAKSPDFSKRVGCRAEEEGEYSDELSWVVSRKTTFQRFWATIHQQRRVGDLQKNCPRRRNSSNDVLPHLNLLKRLTTSQGTGSNVATYSFEESEPQPRNYKIFLAIHSGFYSPTLFERALTAEAERVTCTAAGKEEAKSR